MISYDSSKGLFYYPFVGMTLLVLIFMGALALLLESWVYDRNDQELIRIANITIDSMEQMNATRDEMEIIADSVGQVTNNMRVSIIDQSGRILGDSAFAPEQFKSFNNQLAHQEVKQALAQGAARIVRFSQHQNADTYFYAIRFSENDVNGVVRVSMSIDELYKAISKLRWLIVAFALGAVVAVGALIATFSRHLKFSIAKEHSLLEKRVEERTKEIEMLQRIASMLAACNSVDEVQKVVGDIVPNVLGPIPCSVSLMSESNSLIEQKINWGGEWPGHTTFSSDECWALRKGRYHISKDKHSSLTCYHMGEVKEKTLCIPLLAHGQPMGLLHVLIDEHEVDLNIAFTIAEHLGLALANLNMQDKLREQAIKDPLTKLFNRRYMDEVIEKELHRSKRHGNHFSLLLLDIDHFKPFNDKFGHDAGDHVLKTLGLMLMEAMRTEDMACRVGGEEFAVLLPETDLDNAKQCAAKINRLVKAEDLYFNGQPLGKLTVSIGIASYKLNGRDATTLFKAADIALYDAKNSGRDRYKVATSATTEKVLDIKSGMKKKS